MHDRWEAMMSSHPVCTRRGWRVRHLRAKTHTLELCKSLLHYKLSLSHHPNHIMAEFNCQWTPRHIIPQLHQLCVSILTELALLGLGHGRPVPGPLGTKKTIQIVVRKCINELQISGFTILHVYKGSHVDSWHSRTHGVVWRPHSTTKVLRQTKKQPFFSFHLPPERTCTEEDSIQWQIYMIQRAGFFHSVNVISIDCSDCWLLPLMISPLHPVAEAKVDLHYSYTFSCIPCCCSQYAFYY